MENKVPSGDAPPPYSAITAPDTQSFHPQILPYTFGMGNPYGDGAWSHHLTGAQQISNAHVVHVSPLVHQQSTIPTLNVTPPHNGPIIQAPRERSRGSITIALVYSAFFILFLLVFIVISV